MCKKGANNRKAVIAIRVLRTMYKATKNIATKEFGFILTKVTEDIATFNQAIEELISIYLKPLDAAIVNILVIGC